ncbi:cation ABC transporter permease [candidate division WOR-3 bacterium JGI_Cruoil_03_51_56]|uniref:Cation ABC transporter permease n=1 Tax=candidate division WOR-3 bacterium JGI_Cruoil_03_51_56 TaxID=1973747 RepID=A0A235BUX2_UNCW3|nr:MAG: cation ABC transporter permease [candidate division WOR-3 bacterium JGI_Cruoil_03_51_56]
MFEALQFPFAWRALAAAILGGGACGIVGVWVILMRIPFVGVALSHAAFAGAVFGLLLGINPLFSAVVACVTSSLLIGPIAERSDLEPNISIGIIFSIVLGLAFLGIGLMRGPRTGALRFIWGNILLVSPADIIVMIVMTAVVLGFLFMFFNQIQAVLFNREIARATGIPEKALFIAMLVLCGLTVTANLNTIGGLLIFSLIVNPPSAAYQLTYRLKTMYLLSGLFGIGSCLVGLLISYLTDAPSGAVIIITSSIVFGFALVFSPKRRRLKLKKG